MKHFHVNLFTTRYAILGDWFCRLVGLWICSLHYSWWLVLPTCWCTLSTSSLSLCLSGKLKDILLFGNFFWILSKKFRFYTLRLLIQAILETEIFCFTDLSIGVRRALFLKRFDTFLRNNFIIFFQNSLILSVLGNILNLKFHA